MVRNAVDHGIEASPARIAAGKQALGTVTLRAWHEAGPVVIEVADDGRGLDAAAIAEAAVAKGLVADDAIAAMAEQEKLALMFLPGLSTAKRVSEISGRGVGWTWSIPTSTGSAEPSTSIPRLDRAQPFGSSFR